MARDHYRTTDSQAGGNTMIVQRTGKWVVLSMSGATLGEYESREDAAERLRQVEAAKAAQVEAELQRRMRDRAAKKR